MNHEGSQASNDIDVSFIFENEYICKNPSAFSGLISIFYSRVSRAQVRAKIGTNLSYNETNERPLQGDVHIKRLF